MIPSRACMHDRSVLQRERMAQIVSDLSISVKSLHYAYETIFGWPLMLREKHPREK